MFTYMPILCHIKGDQVFNHLQENESEKVRYINELKSAAKHWNPDPWHWRWKLPRSELKQLLLTYWVLISWPIVKVDGRVPLFGRMTVQQLIATYAKTTSIEEPEQ